MLRVVLGFAVLVCCSCATSKPPHFTSPERLEEWASKSAPDEVIPSRAVLRAWELEGPFPGEVVRHEAPRDDLWGRELREVLAALSSDALETEDMACVARELGRVHLAEGRWGDPSLSTFVAEHCGSAARWIRGRALYGEPTETEEEFLARRQEDFRRRVEEALEDERDTIAVWFGRSEERLVAFIASGRWQVRLEPLSLHPPSGETVRVNGSLTESFRRVEALITRGARGWARCESDSSLAPPDFSFRCVPDPEDASFLVEIVGMDKERLMFPRALLRFHPGGTLDPVFRGDGLVPKDLPAISPREEFIFLLNRIRAEASLPPLELAIAQSDSIDRLLAHYALANFDEREDDRLEILRGIRAGWDVGGPVRGADHAYRWKVTSAVDSLLESLLRTPLGRQRFLSPERDRIAIGVRREPNGMVALAAFYWTFREADQRELIDEVLDALAAERERRGKSYPYWLNEVEDAAMRAVERVESGTHETKEALQILAYRSHRVLRGTSKTWATRVSSMRDIEFPEYMLEADRFGIAVSVARYQRPGEPWERYVVFIVTNLRR